jgi:putative aminopeptidase FrvX
MKDFLRELASIPGGTGFDDDVAKEMLRQLAELALDVSTGDRA